MKKKAVNEVENISLSAKQIKTKLEDSLAYDHSKYHNSEVLFNTKPNPFYKLPFSDFKIAISEELSNQQLLLENLHQYVSEVKLIEEEVEEEVLTEVEEEENNINVVEEVYEFDEIEEEDEFEEDEDDIDDEDAERPYDDSAKKPRVSYTFIKIVDVNKVIEKIKREAIEKNKGKPVISRRQVNKMLKPYMVKRNNTMDIDGIDDSLTSIDIYLNAVNKIANTNEAPLHENSHDALELNIHEILEDLEK